jgi:hypothetical protein
VRLASDTADSVATIAAPIAAQLRAALADSSFLSQAQKLALALVFELLRGVARTTSKTHTWLNALEQQALAQSHLSACSGARIRATSLSWRSAKR